MLLTVAVAAGGLFTMIFLAGPIRRAGVYTVPAYLQMRYQSKRVRLVGAIIFAVAAWAYTIPQLTAGGITMGFVLPQLGYQLGVAVAAVGFALYVALGGMWAVTWTDFIQGIMMVALSLIPLPVILLEFGGVGGTLSAAIASDPGFAGSTESWVTHLGISLVWILGVLSLPQFGQRILSSESDKAARRGFMWLGPLYILTFGLSSFIVAGGAMAVEPNLANPDFFYYLVLDEFFGPLVQGLGAALMEKLDYDTDTGQLLNANFTDYKVPSITDVPMVEADFVEIPSESTPGGWKGVAEGPFIAAPPAVANAVCDAIGVHLTELPLTPERVKTAIDDAD
jgi:Na+/proline symporter